MKKLITGLVFSLLIFVACVSPILADGASVALDLTEMQRYEMADSLCWIDDSLYVLGNKGVYSWKSGSEKMNTVIDLTAAFNYDYVQDCPEDESEAAVWNQMLQLIFTDGEALYGLHPYSGMIKKIEGNVQTDVAEIQQEYLYSEDMEAYDYETSDLDLHTLIINAYTGSIYNPNMTGDKKYYASQFMRN